MTFVEPLDIQRILVNNLAGSVEIFIFLIALMLGLASAKMRIPGIAMMVIFSIFAIMVSVIYPGLYLIVAILIGLIVFNIASKLITR